MSFHALQHYKLRLLGLAFILFALAGCGHKKVIVVPPPPISVSAPAPVVEPFNGHVTIYTVSDKSPQADANGLVPTTVDVNTDSKSPARDAINALISYPNSAMPTGTKLLHIDIDQSTGLATVDFSSEFKDNFRGGDTREAQILESIRETLGQFANIQNVQILVAGKKIDSLGGTEDLTDPLPTIRNNKESAAAS
jgi:spore germination protein GerM